MEKDQFIKILQENKPDQMMEFLLNNGKKTKPFSPFYFISKDKEREDTDNGKLNG